MVGTGIKVQAAADLGLRAEPVDEVGAVVDDVGLDGGEDGGPEGCGAGGRWRWL